MIFSQPLSPILLRIWEFSMQNEKMGIFQCKMQNTFGPRTRTFSLRKLLSIVTLRAGELKLRFNVMHAWTPSTVTCFYPIYYPDFSAFYFNSTIYIRSYRLENC